MDFVLFFSCFSLAFGVLFILFGTEKTQLTKGIEISQTAEIAAYIIGAILIFAGFFGFYIGLRHVVARHKKHLEKLHERDQKRKQTMNV